MNISLKFFQSYELCQGKPVANIQILVYEEFITLTELDLIFECSLGSFVVNGKDTGQNKLACHTDGTGEVSVSIIGPDVGGDGQLTVFLQENGRQIGIQPYHLKATAHYTLNFNVINDYAMADGIQSNTVKAILTGTGSGVNLAKRKLDLSVTGSASFEKGQIIQSTSVDTDASGNASFGLYNINQDGEAVTLTGFLEASKTAHATEQIHFQRNLDCDASPPRGGIYIRTIFTYSINNQQYLLRQRECDHLVTVHKLIAGGQQGEKTSAGQKWVNFYDLIFPFVLGEQQYIFGLARNFINTPQNNTHKSYWMIAKLDEKGHKEIVDCDYWDSNYDVGFAYKAGKGQFIYLHSKDKDSNGEYPYVIYEILPNGKMGKLTEQSSWDNFYGATFFFSMGGIEYIYIHTITNNNAFTYELSKDGKIGNKNTSNTWEYYYYPEFSYIIEGTYYYAGQRFYDNYWFVSYIYSGGVPDPINEHDNPWDTNYQYQVPFSIDGHQYFLRQDQSKDHWYITELLADTNMGSDTDSSVNH
ncbi:hypothetical protein [Xenorhabdus cabanillasii]|uniref:Big-1 domain-containing protein n=1 Tax=Xenorhabdus cabanillasii JM26 TaxID=1427517 RepID=W1INR0_9GAMM|nr:hypothetical protein [Xenorhabdus cabanillasii]PHM78147.1 hypothetical protein Xcab_01197 [Xenorhabdus cabanillasii JM26]CDL79448.1 conserved hypothetical protein [Xenorhabdus cabanillasii JM26]